MSKLLTPEEMTSRDYYFDSYAHFGIHEVKHPAGRVAARGCPVVTVPSTVTKPVPAWPEAPGPRPPTLSPSVDPSGRGQARPGAGA